jgi:hypothetical protein
MKSRQLPALLCGVVFLVLAACLPAVPALAAEQGESAKGVNFVWIEGEAATADTFEVADPAGLAGADPAVLSGGKWLFHDGTVPANQIRASATWRFAVAVPGNYTLYCRKYWHHGPFEWRIDGGTAHRAERFSLLDEVKAGEFATVNWVKLGEVNLGGSHVLTLTLLGAAPGAAGTADWARRGHPYVAGIDCFCLVGPGTEFVARGKLKPGEAEPGLAAAGWWAFQPDADPSLHATAGARSPIDMRDILGQGPVTRKVEGRDGKFYYAGTDEEVRFWGVCVQAPAVNMAEERVAELAAKLAKRGVNLVRVHAPVTANCTSGDPRVIDDVYLANLYTFVQKMKAEGIYTALSIYFPKWFEVNGKWRIPGYNVPPFEGMHPWCLLFFDAEMQDIYKAWVEAVLLYDPDGPGPLPHLGKDDGVAIWEVCNDDSLFSWQFRPEPNALDPSEKAPPLIPEAAIAPLEALWKAWLVRDYGSVSGAFGAWGGHTVYGDVLNERAVLMRSWLMSDQYLSGPNVPAGALKRAQDQIEFMGKVMRDFYAQCDADVSEIAQGCPDTYGGNTYWNPFGGPWNPQDRLGDYGLDLMDRHCYFAGTRVRWNTVTEQYETVDPRKIGPYDGDGDMPLHVSENDVYVDMVASEWPELLRVREDQYVGRTHLVSEYSFPMVNRFRTCSALMAAAYGALQGTDAFCFFRVDDEKWCRTLGTWPVMTPAVLGQFPAAALAFRRGDIEEGLRTHYWRVSPSDAPGNLLHKPRKFAYYGGRVEREYGSPSYSNEAPEITYHNPNPGVRRVWRRRGPGQTRKLVEMVYGKPVNENDWRPRVLCDTDRFQAASGMLHGRTVQLADCTFKGPRKGYYGCFMVVSLDGEDINTSTNILVQVMSEEQTYGFESAPDLALDMSRVTAVGTGPVNVKDIGGSITVDNVNAGAMEVWALDANGQRLHTVAKTPPSNSVNFDLEKDVLYYQIVPAGAAAD